MAMEDTLHSLFGASEEVLCRRKIRISILMGTADES